MKLSIQHLAMALMILISSMSSIGTAWTETPTAEKAHRFIYRMKSPQNVEVFEFSSTAPSYEDAFEKAADACFKHFKNGKKLTEDRGLDIIDVCANPRSL